MEHTAVYHFCRLRVLIQIGEAHLSKPILKFVSPRKLSVMLGMRLHSVKRRKRVFRLDLEEDDGSQSSKRCRRFPAFKV